MDNGLKAAEAFAGAAAEASFEARPHPSAGDNKVEVAYATHDEVRRMISANAALLARRSSPAFASAPPLVPPLAEGVAALIAAVHDYLRPSLRDSGFPLAEAFAREWRQREAAAADARNLASVRLAQIRKDSAQLYSDLNAARDCLDALDQANQGLRKERDAAVAERDAAVAERDAAVAERVEQEAVEALGESLIGEGFVEILDAGIRTELHDRHPDDLSARLAEEFALRDKERADLREELRDTKERLETARRIVEERNAGARAKLDAFEKLATIIRPALRPELIGGGGGRSPLALDDALREELRLRGEETAAASARIAALEASLADCERSNRALQQGLDAERVVMAEMQAATQRLEHAIVHQAISLYEADAGARAFARGVAMRRAAAQG
jgi:hypothetical protein